MPLEPETSALVQWLFLGVLAVVAVANLLILGLWLAGILRGRPLLAPAWSVADVFLGFEAVAATILVVGIFMMSVATTIVVASTRGAAGDVEGSVMALAIVPMMLAQQAALVAVPLGFVRLRYRESIAALGLAKPDALFWRQVGLGAILGLALLPLNDLVEVVSRHWILDSGAFPHSQLLRRLTEQMDAVRVLEEMRSRPAALLGLVAIIGVIGPIAEEVFFRGFAYTAFKRRFGGVWAVPLSAFVFAVVHGNPVGLIPIFMVGLVLAVLFQRSGSLAAPIGLHCANNTVVVVMYLLAPGFSFWGGLFR